MKFQRGEQQGRKKKCGVILYGCFLGRVRVCGIAKWRHSSFTRAYHSGVEEGGGVGGSKKYTLRVVYTYVFS